jgi:hypothetical protein
VPSGRAAAAEGLVTAVVDGGELKEGVVLGEADMLDLAALDKYEDANAEVEPG